MSSGNIVLDISGNSINYNNYVRLQQDIRLNRERIYNMRINSATDICIVIILMLGLTVITYYVYVTLHP